MHYEKGEEAKITDKHLTREMEGERQKSQERVSAGVEQTNLEFASPVLTKAQHLLLQARLFSALYVPGQN